MNCIDDSIDKEPFYNTLIEYILYNHKFQISSLYSEDTRDQYRPKQFSPSQIDQTFSGPSEAARQS